MSNMQFSRRLLLPALLVATSPGFAASGQAAAPPLISELTLLVYERAGCAWCLRWNREVASVYPQTDVGRQLPLRRIDLDRPGPDDPRLDDPVRFTPTFVLMRDGREIGRITGYHNDGFFWGLLEAMLREKTTATQQQPGLKSFHS